MQVMAATAPGSLPFPLLQSSRKRHRCVSIRFKLQSMPSQRESSFRPQAILEASSIDVVSKRQQKS